MCAWAYDNMDETTAARENFERHEPPTHADPLSGACMGNLQELAPRGSHLGCGQGQGLGPICAARPPPACRLTLGGALPLVA